MPVSDSQLTPKSSPSRMFATEIPAARPQYRRAPLTEYFAGYLVPRHFNCGKQLHPSLLLNFKQPALANLADTKLGPWPAIVNGTVTGFLGSGYRGAPLQSWDLQQVGLGKQLKGKGCIVAKFVGLFVSDMA